MPVTHKYALRAFGGAAPYATIATFVDSSLSPIESVTSNEVFSVSDTGTSLSDISNAASSLIVSDANSLADTIKETFLLNTTDAGIALADSYAEVLLFNVLDGALSVTEILLDTAPEVLNDIALSALDSITGIVLFLPIDTITNTELLQEATYIFGSDILTTSDNLQNIIPTAALYEYIIGRIRSGKITSRV